MNYIKELYNTIETISEELQNYSDGYICDIISEIADSNIDIYTYALLNWLKDNYDVVDEAVSELGMPNANDSNIIIKLCQQGQYIQNQNTLYCELDQAMFNWCLSWLESEEVETLTDEQLEQLQEKCENVDNNDQLEDWIEFLKELVNIGE